MTGVAVALKARGKLANPVIFGFIQLWGGSDSSIMTPFQSNLHVSKLCLPFCYRTGQGYVNVCINIHSSKNGQGAFLHSILVKCPYRQIQSCRKKSVTSGKLQGMF